MSSSSKWISGASLCMPAVFDGNKFIHVCISPNWEVHYMFNQTNDLEVEVLSAVHVHITYTTDDQGQC